MGLLDGQRAVITGGASGIGAATARRMHEEGALVAIVDDDADGAAAVATEVEGVAFTADVADPEQCTAAIGAAADALGGLSVLFNNAGIGAARPLHEYSDRAWAKIVGVNLTGTFHGIRAAVPLLQRRRLHREPRVGVRDAPDAVRRSVLRCQGGRDLAHDGCRARVRAGHPRQLRVARIHRHRADRRRARRPEPACRGRGGHAARTGRVRAVDVANAVVFLASPLAAYVTGHNLVVDGGSYLPNAQADAILRQFGM